MNKIKGYSIQNGEPTPDNPVEIESLDIKDIKLIDGMVKEYNTFGDLDNPDYEDTDRIYKAIENILAERKQDKARIQELQDMLKEKDKKIEKLRNNKKDLLRKLRNRIKEVKKLERKDYKSIVTKQGKILEERAEQLKKKDKIIEQINKDIEANIYLAESNYNVEELNDYARGVYDTYINMRKQYFERKVRE